MKTIQFSNPHRKKHFEFFSQMDQPHFSLCANMDITKLSHWLKAKEVPFTPAMVYCIANTANSIPAFKQRIRGEVIVEHDFVSPSFTVLTEVSEVFSFCTVEYHSSFDNFVSDAIAMINKMKEDPSLEDEEGRDDYLFMSAIPWVSFTNIQHAMHYSPADSVPRIAWGKFFKENGRLKMPLSVQAHHALVDGIHMGQFFTRIQELFDQPNQLKPSGILV